MAAAAAAIVLSAACGGSNGSVTDSTEFVSRSGGSVLNNDTTAATDPATASTELSTQPTSRQPVSSGSNSCESVRSAGSHLEDLTVTIGVDNALLGMRGHAVAAGDVNGDGFVDLFVGGFADRDPESYQVRGADGPAPDRLLLGSASGFALDASFPDVFGRTSGAAFADLDNDGDLDLIIARNPRESERGAAPSEVMINDDGRFSTATVLDDSRGLRSIGVLDYDADGLLDLFMVEDRFRGGSSLLLANRGQLEFENVTASAGLPTDLAGLGVAAADLDRSGSPDLFIAGDNRLFSNTDGQFSEVHGPFAWDYFGDEDDVAGVSVGDINGDGLLDLVVGQHFNSTIDAGALVPIRVYLNAGGSGAGLTFTDATAESQIAAFPTKAPHVEAIDLDGDGNVDILTSASAGNGSVPAVLLNRGGDQPTFETPDGIGAKQYWVAGAIVDVDGDPDPEIFLVEWEPAIGSRLFDAVERSGDFVSVKVGPTGAAGVGSVVDVFVAGSSDLVQTVPIVASTGYGSGSAPVARIGVGQTAAVDIVVERPWGQPEIRITGVAAGSNITVDPDGSWACTRP